MRVESIIQQLLSKIWIDPEIKKLLNEDIFINSHIHIDPTAYIEGKYFMRLLDEIEADYEDLPTDLIAKALIKMTYWIIMVSVMINLANKKLIKLHSAGKGVSKKVLEDKVKVAMVLSNRTGHFTLNYPLKEEIRLVANDGKDVTVQIPIHDWVAGILNAVRRTPISDLDDTTIINNEAFKIFVDNTEYSILDFPDILIKKLFKI